MRTWNVGWFAVLASVAALACNAPAAGTSPAGTYEVDHPPPDIRDLIERFNDPERRDGILDAIPKVAAAEPYFRRLRYEPFSTRGERLIALLTELGKRREERVMARAAGWVKNLRVDLMVDFECGSRYHDLGAQAGFVRQLKATLGDRLDRLLPDRVPAGLHWGGGLPMAEIRDNYIGYRERHVDLNHISDQYLSITAQTCDILQKDRSSWVCLVRDRLRDTKPVVKNSALITWDYSLLASNGPIPTSSFQDVTRGVFICEGDVDLPSGSDLAMIGGSVIIINGKLRAPKRPHLNGCYIWAADGMEFAEPPEGIYKRKDSPPSTILASGGAIDLGPKAAPPPPGVVRPHLKSDPLGFRFFRTQDVGVEAAMRPAGLTITKLTADSPLAAYGVREGDVVTGVFDDPVGTAAEFRRRLRQAVAYEYGVFHIRRGAEATTRIVWFTDLPGLAAGR